MPLTLAEETIISNKTYSSGTTIDLVLENFVVQVGAGNVTSIRIQGEETETAYLLSESDCKRIKSEKICYEKKIDSTVRIVIYDLTAQIIPTFTFNKTSSFSVGDIIGGTIWINNTGERLAENVRMELNLHPNISAEEIEDCTYSKNQLSWEGNILSEGHESCTFTLRINGIVDETFQVVINYTSFDYSFSEESKDSYTIKAENPFIFEVNVSGTTNLEPKQPFIISFHVATEDEDNNITLDPFYLEYDEKELRYLLTDLVRVSTPDDQVTTTKIVSSIKNLTGKFKLMPLFSNTTGTFKIGFSYNTTKDSQQRTFYQTFNYNTIYLPLLLSTEPKELSFESMREGIITINILNPYRYQTYKGYDIKATFSLNGETIRKKLPYDKSRIVAQIPYVMPDVLFVQKESITIEIQAKTTEGEIVTIEKTFDIRILPLQEILIEKVTSTTEDLSATTIDLYVTSKHQEPVIVTFKEKIPEGLFARGITELTKEILPNERVKIYTYDLLSTEKEIILPNITTKYTYNYLGNYIEREETIILEPILFEKPIVNKTIENTTIITPPIEIIEREQPSILHIIIAATILFLLVIVTVVWEWIQHINTFKIQHKSIIKQYQEFIDNGQLLRKRKKELEEEQQLLRKKMDLVEIHTKGYDAQLPAELKKMSEKKEEIIKMEAVIKERHEKLKVRIGELQTKEQTLFTYEHNFEEFLGRIAQREERLKEDDELLHQDFKTLKENQEAITKQIDNNYKQQHLMKDRMKHFKAKHVSNLNSKITLLATRKKRTMKYHKQLEQEETHIKEEFEKLEKDLELSKEDLERAEKLYKQATIQLKKGQHEEEKATPEEKHSD